MDNNGDDTENTAKVSDSAYSNSCSNSQSRKSHSSKSTHSGSNSSGSSGYGGKQSTSGSSKTLSQIPEKRTKDKEGKKKKQAQTELVNIQADVEFRLPEPAPVTETKEKPHNVASPSASNPQLLKGVPRIKESTKKHNNDQDPGLCDKSQQLQIATTKSCHSVSQFPDSSQEEGFSCVISMLDGVVLYMSASLTTALEFPKDMWIGRSFIDFIHPSDHTTFASQITSGLAVPKKANGMQEQAESPTNTSVSTMFCRIRRHRGLSEGFAIKDRPVTFRPFMLRLSFKNICDEMGLVIYLVIQATPLWSAFKISNEIIANAVSFTMRHVANGNLEYVDDEAVPYLGYMPQDILGQDVLKLYHPEDLAYVRHVYENIVKQGQVPRSKPYRLLAQNGDYLKLETEWSSFINPWSRKLEFVIGKHHIIEGPENPDVFEPPPPKPKNSEEDNIEIESLKQSIVMILNEVPTKPAEVAKQQMTKRCQDIASFMESLIEDQPKLEEELRLEIHENDNSYFERDSVMLGGISPHHDYNDRKSSSSTPLSYNQLNFNINMKRYFDSHQDSLDDKLKLTDSTSVPLKVTEHENVELSPIAHHSGDSVEMESLSMTFGEHQYQPLRLTEFVLTKHNSDMEKIFVKKHRETRPVNKQEREKMSNETKQKKKDHLVRCNASFVPAAVNLSAVNAQDAGVASHAHGQKRASKQFEQEPGAHKQHCASTRQMRRRPPTTGVPALPAVAVATVSTSASMWEPNFVNGMNPYMSQQMSLMSPVTAMPGFVPMYYVPTAGHAVPRTSENSTFDPNKNTTQQQFQAPAVQYMMYGQAVFGSPIVMSPINHQGPFSVQQNVMQNQSHRAQNNLRLTTHNYEQAFMPALPLKPPSRPQLQAWREEKRDATPAATTAVTTATTPTTIAASPVSSKTCQGRSPSSSICSATNALNRSTEAVPGSSVSRDSKMKSEETVDRTDGESSYSSFYSSFFKTESGSADDSGDAKKMQNVTKHMGEPNTEGNDFTCYKQPQRRKTGPPWMEHVSVTSELIYKYQVVTKSLDEVLISDKQKLVGLEQSSLVNEQLGQLYTDLQLEGVAARLTLEEGVTSSGSSSEENNKKAAVDTLSKRARRKRKYSKLVMIYEEDAPLPPPDEESEGEPSASVA